MKDVLLNALKYGVIFFVISVIVHFIFPDDVDMVTCFIIFAATGLAEFILGLIRYRRTQRDKER